MQIILAVLSTLLAVAAFFSAVVVRIGATIGNHQRARRGEPGFVSSTPVVGSILGFAAVLLAPVGTILHRLCWAWVPLALELAVKVTCDLTFLLVERPSR